jgi:hypothetical protein
VPLLRWHDVEAVPIGVSDPNGWDDRSDGLYGWLLLAMTPMAQYAGMYARDAPIQGTRVASGGGCGDGVTYHAAGINFDKPAPYWVPYRQGDGPPIRVDELRFPYKVTPEDPSVLLVEVEPGDCYCRWIATLHWIDGSEQGETRIDDRGQPFETTSGSALPSYTWQDGERLAL